MDNKVSSYSSQKKKKKELRHIHHIQMNFRKLLESFEIGIIRQRINFRNIGEDLKNREHLSRYNQN